MKAKPKKRQGRRTKRNELYCMDCGVRLSPELTAEIKMTRKALEMPNMLVFCDDCHTKVKNRLRRIWNGIQYLFE
jgi:RNase P subunit RPR2